MASNFNQNRSFETRSGIGLDTNELPYKITTEDVNKYIQNRVTALQSKSAPGSEPVDVQIYTTESSNKFFPFVCVLSPNACTDMNKKTHNDGVDPFFTPERETGGKQAHLEPWLYALMKNYKFDKSDGDYFGSDSGRRNLGLSRQNADTLRNLIDPRIYNNNGKMVGVYFLVDPIRVFWEMLDSKDDTRPYEVNIISQTKKDSGNYIYKVIRTIKKHKGHHGGKNAIFEELNALQKRNNR